MFLVPFWGFFKILVATKESVETISVFIFYYTGAANWR